MTNHWPEATGHADWAAPLPGCGFRMGDSKFLQVFQKSHRRPRSRPAVSCDCATTSARPRQSQARPPSTWRLPYHQMRRSDPPLALSLLAVNCRYTHGESALADSVLGRSGFSWESAPLPVRGPPGPWRAFMEFDLHCTSWVFPAFSWIFIKFNFFSISWIFRNFPEFSAN